MFRSKDEFDAAIERHFIPLDENDFVDWIVDAAANDCIAYYRGHLGRDCCESAGILSYGDCRKLVAVSRRVDPGRERWLRSDWRRECDWDPKASEFAATILLGRARLSSNFPRKLSPSA